MKQGNAPRDNRIIPDMHPSLPKGLTMHELGIWLETNAAEKFTDEQKRFFTPEEIKDFEHESSINGREINKLEDLIKEISAKAKKGNDQPFTFTLPVTIGTKLLTQHRRENDDYIEKGYEVIETPIYGIPNVDTHNMEYFDIEGNLVPDRTRPLSPKEKHQFVGIFKNLKNNNDGTSTDTTTGEILDNTGT